MFGYVFVHKLIENYTYTCMQIYVYVGVDIYVHGCFFRKYTHIIMCMHVCVVAICQNTYLYVCVRIHLNQYVDVFFK